MVRSLFLLCSVCTEAQKSLPCPFSVSQPLGRQGEGTASPGREAGTGCEQVVTVL